MPPNQGLRLNLITTLISPIRDKQVNYLVFTRRKAQCNFIQDDKQVDYKVMLLKPL